MVVALLSDASAVFTSWLAAAVPLAVWQTSSCKRHETLIIPEPIQPN